MSESSQQVNITQNDEVGGEKRRREKRIKTSHACVFCQRSHLTCDESRPCARCVKRKIGHLCHDSEKRKLDVRVASPLESPSAAFQSSHLPTTGSTESLEVEVAPIAEILPLVKPDEFTLYDYGASYHRLRTFYEQRFSMGNRSRMAAASADAHKEIVQVYTNLTVQNLIDAEQYLWKCVIEYDQVMLEMSTPLLLIRRCCGVLRASESFAELIGISIEDLKSYYFYELCDQETMTNYYEKGATLVEANDEQSLVTNCMLIHGGNRMDGDMRDGDEYCADQNYRREIACTMSFRIRRDQFGIPMLVAINFIPMVSIKPTTYTG